MWCIPEASAEYVACIEEVLDQYERPYDTQYPQVCYNEGQKQFYEEKNQFAYVEPVAIDPDYRRLGLGKVAVLEGIQRCAELGAKEAFVGSDQLFYQAIGFQKVYNSECWVNILIRSRKIGFKEEKSRVWYDRDFIFEFWKK